MCNHPCIRARSHKMGQRACCYPEELICASNTRFVLACTAGNARNVVPDWSQKARWQFIENIQDILEVEPDRPDLHLHLATRKTHRERGLLANHQARDGAAPCDEYADWTPPRKAPPSARADLPGPVRSSILHP